MTSALGIRPGIELAHRGAKLAISDIDTRGSPRPRRWSKQARRHGRPEQREVVLAYADDVVAASGGHIQQRRLHGNIKEMSFDWVMDVKLSGCPWSGPSIPAAPHRLGRRSTSSTSRASCLFSVPTQSAYNAANLAVRGSPCAGDGAQPALILHLRASWPHRPTSPPAGRVHNKLASSFDKMAHTSPKAAAVARSRATRLASDGVGARATF